MKTFYDNLAPLYHLIFENWEKSIHKQGKILARIIRDESFNFKNILDVSCGIGTQSIGLSKNRFNVTASDLSSGAINRAIKESKSRRLNIKYSVCDILNASKHHQPGYDVVLSCDNSIPHLLSDRKILRAFKEMRLCIKPGGIRLISIRDYEKEETGKNIFKPYGIRLIKGKRILVYQIQDYIGVRYNFKLIFIVENLKTGKFKIISMKSKNYAIKIDKIRDLMKKAGFKNIKVIKNQFYQPVLIGKNAT